MNINRLYLVDISDPDNLRQAEVARSQPNEPMPTVEWEVPVEYEVCRIKVVVGYGNTDTYLFANHIPAEVELQLRVPEVDNGH